MDQEALNRRAAERAFCQSVLQRAYSSAGLFSAGLVFSRPAIEGFFAS
jgi:hypothetical protein